MRLKNSNLDRFHVDSVMQGQEAPGSHNCYRGEKKISKKYGTTRENISTMIHWWFDVNCKVVTTQVNDARFIGKFGSVLKIPEMECFSQVWIALSAVFTLFTPVGTRSTSPP